MHDGEVDHQEPAMVGPEHAGTGSYVSLARKGRVVETRGEATNVKSSERRKLEKLERQMCRSWSDSRHLCDPSYCPFS